MVMIHIRLFPMNESIKEQMSKLISLIIPNYNYGEYLEQCIESVLNQNVMPKEIIVIDDCSTDRSEEILKRYDSHKEITIVRNERNLGIVSNFRKAVDLAEGELIVFVGADNWVHEDFIEKYVESVESNPEAAIHYCDLIIFGRRASLLAQAVEAAPIADGKFLWKFPDPTSETISKLETTNFMHGSSLFQRNWYQKVGGYQDTKNPEDFDLFRRIVFAGGIPVHVPHATLEYRQHSIGQANTSLMLEEHVKNLENSIEELCAQIEEMKLSIQNKDLTIKNKNDELNEIKESIVEVEQLLASYGFSSLNSFSNETKGRSRKSRLIYQINKLFGFPFRLYRKIR